MSIEKRTTKQRGVAYATRLRTPEGRVHTRTFRTKLEPIQFEADQRSSRGRGRWVDARRAVSVTFSEWAKLRPSRVWNWPDVDRWAIDTGRTNKAIR